MIWRIIWHEVRRWCNVMDGITIVMIDEVSWWYPYHQVSIIINENMRLFDMIWRHDQLSIFCWCYSLVIRGPYYGLLFVLNFIILSYDVIWYDICDSAIVWIQSQWYARHSMMMSHFGCNIRMGGHRHYGVWVLYWGQWCCRAPTFCGWRMYVWDNHCECVTEWDLMSASSIRTTTS